MKKRNPLKKTLDWLTGKDIKRQSAENMKALQQRHEERMLGLKQQFPKNKKELDERASMELKQKRLKFKRLDKKFKQRGLTVEEAHERAQLAIDLKLKKAELLEHHARPKIAAERREKLSPEERLSELEERYHHITDPWLRIPHGLTAAEAEEMRALEHHLNEKENQKGKKKIRFGERK